MVQFQAIDRIWHKKLFQRDSMVGTRLNVDRLY